MSNKDLFLGKKQIFLFVLLSFSFFIPLVSSVSTFGYDTQDDTVSITVGNLTRFTQLVDTPASFTGNASSCAVVNGGETALVFASCSTGAGDITAVFPFTTRTLFVSNSSTTDDIYFNFNETYMNRTIEAFLGNGSFVGGDNNFFDQSLNTTDNVTFFNITATGHVVPTTDSVSTIGRTLTRWLTGFFDNVISDNGNFTNIYADNWANVTITESQISDLQTYLLWSNAVNGTLMVTTGDTATGNYTFDTTTFHIDSTSGRIGIGTATPQNTLDIVGDTNISVGNNFSVNEDTFFVDGIMGRVTTGTLDSTIPFVVASTNLTVDVVSLKSEFETSSALDTGWAQFRFQDSSDGPSFFGGKARANRSEPRFAQVNDVLFTVAAMGSDGNRFAQGSRLDFYAEENISVGSSSGRIGFFTTPTGTQSPVERMRVAGNGMIGMNTTTPQNVLHIKGNGSSDDQVLRLEDAEVCEIDPDVGGLTVTCSSDESLKENIKDITQANIDQIVNRITSIPLKQFNVKNNNEFKVGVIAQEYSLLHPNLVTNFTRTIERPYLPDRQTFGGYDRYNITTYYQLGVQQPNVWETTLLIQELYKENTQMKASLCQLGVIAWC